MWKWLLGIVVLAGVSFFGYDYYRGGFYSAPELQEGDFLLSYKNGFKGVMRGITEERGRKYLGMPAKDVPSWYEDTWSICRKPTEEETASFERENVLGPGGRLDAVCEVDADGDVFVRGWIGSVPNL